MTEQYRGAPMGQPTQGGQPDLSVPFNLARVRINNSGYDSSGAYWGLGLPLWYAASGRWDEFFRAENREAAKASIRNVWPNARFFR